MAAMIRGLVFYEGPSALNGMPIVGIMTFYSKNDKIGRGNRRVVQTWYLHRDKHPLEACADGSDSAVCGNCRLRGKAGKKRACYVMPLHGPTPVWKYYKDGNYGIYDPLIHNSLFFTRVLRLGAYGEPVSIPLTVQKPFINASRSVIGYTHYWNRKRYQYWNRLVMASVHSPMERDVAHKMGWRTFRARLPEQPVLEGEFICPASSEGGHKAACWQCGACNGSGTKASPTIVVHGSPMLALPNITKITKAAA